MKAKYLSIIWLLIGSLYFSDGIMAQDALSPQDLIQKANQAYTEGQYSDALRYYNQVYQQGYESAPLLMNIGNAHFKLNDIPSSILFYERALRHAPNNEDIAFNLGLARSRIIDKIEDVPKLFFLQWWDQIKGSLSLESWTYLSIISFVAFLLFFAAYLIAKRVWSKQLFFWPAMIFLLLGLHAVLFSSQLKSDRISRPEAIIFSPTVTVKSSPDHSSIDLFVLHEGTKVQVSDSLGEWIEIRIASGSKGWISGENLRKI